MKNIDSAFKHIRLFSFLFLACCTVICGYAVYKSYALVSEQEQRIYILANGKALEAFSADRKDNIPVEAKDHVKTFHRYFFTLDPDDQVIESNLTKALYLADRSAKKQYDNLKENGYYSNVISGNVSQGIEADSVHVDVSSYPYYFRYHGRQIITRATTVVTRNLITQGFLRNVSRSDNNSHGFLIEKWETIENRDIHIQQR